MEKKNKKSFDLLISSIYSINKKLEKLESLDPLRIETLERILSDEKRIVNAIEILLNSFILDTDVYIKQGSLHLKRTQKEIKRKKTKRKLSIKNTILEYIVLSKGITAAELIKKTNFSQKQISDNISRLKREELVISSGQGKNAVYMSIQNRSDG